MTHGENELCRKRSALLTSVWVGPTCFSTSLLGDIINIWRTSLQLIYAYISSLIFNPNLSSQLQSHNIQRFCILAWKSDQYGQLSRSRVTSQWSDLIWSCQPQKMAIPFYSLCMGVGGKEVVVVLGCVKGKNCSGSCLSLLLSLPSAMPPSAANSTGFNFRVSDSDCC